MSCEHDGGEPAPLSPDEQARWDAVKDAASQLAGTIGAGDREGFGAANAAMDQAWKGLDPQRVREALHVPKDAGEHAEALRAMLCRIPDGWGRWISCQRGWYSLVTDLDRELALLDADYELHQVKQKLATLHYYAEPAEKRVTDPEDPEPHAPVSDAEDEDWAAYGREYDAWEERLSAYLERPDIAPLHQKQQRRRELFEQLIAAAEERSASVCERCGNPGRLSRSPRGWLQTLCESCRPEHGYEPAGEQ